MPSLTVYRPPLAESKRDDAVEFSVPFDSLSPDLIAELVEMNTVQQMRFTFLYEQARQRLRKERAARGDAEPEREDADLSGGYPGITLNLLGTMLKEELEYYEWKREHKPEKGISVLVGWYSLRKMLLENNPFKLLGVSTGIGLFWGFWATGWWLEAPIVFTPSIDFARYAFALTLPLLPSYWLSNRFAGSFSPTKWETRVVTLLFVLYFIFVTVPAAPLALLVLPPFLALLLFTLSRNRQLEPEAAPLQQLAGRPHPLNYLFLLFIPLAASLYYSFALSLHLQLYALYLIFLITTPLGFALLALSLLRIWRTPLPRPLSPHRHLDLT